MGNRVRRINLIIIMMVVAVLTGCGNYGRIQSVGEKGTTETIESQEENKKENKEENKEQINKQEEIKENTESSIEESASLEEETTVEPIKESEKETTEISMEESKEQESQPTQEAEEPIETPKPSEKPVSSNNDKLAKIEKEAAVIEKKLQEETTQSELNQLSEEIYELWDSELNSIWKQLMEKMNIEDKKLLRMEEKEWIAYKEEEIQKLLKENEGESILTMKSNLKGAELTKARVYVLAEYLSEYE